MLRTLDARGLADWCAGSLRLLVEHADDLDRSNVYPVADGDTGSNLVTTVAAASQAVAAVEGSGLAEVADAMATGAIAGARGNSGVILSQLLCGVAEVAAGRDELTADDLRAVLRRACELGYAAVATPVEGTILTVVRAAADAAADEAGSLVAVARAAATGAAAALACTPSQLAALAAAGVVDSGGRGLLLVLQALVVSLGGEPVPEQTPASGLASCPVPPAEHAAADGPGYEVQYRLDGADEAGAEDLRTRLSALGDSVVVVCRGDVWSVHLHTDLVGPAVEAGIRLGRPSRIEVVRFADERPAVTEAVTEAVTGRRVVLMLDGDGLAATAAAGGSGVVVLDPADGADPQTLTEVLRRLAAAETVLLPNGLVAPQVAAAAVSRLRGPGRQALMVPTRSPLQGLAALAVHDEQASLADAVVAMSSAAGATRWAEVVVADAESLTSAGICQTGDALGLVGGEVVVIIPIADHPELHVRLRMAAFGVLDRMLSAGGELVTVAPGAQATAGIADDVVRHVAATRPGVEVVTLAGGQPDRLVLLAVE